MNRILATRNLPRRRQYLTRNSVGRARRGHGNARHRSRWLGSTCEAGPKGLRVRSHRIPYQGGSFDISSLGIFGDETESGRMPLPRGASIGAPRPTRTRLDPRFAERDDLSDCVKFAGAAADSEDQLRVSACPSASMSQGSNIGRSSFCVAAVCALAMSGCAATIIPSQRFGMQDASACTSCEDRHGLQGRCALCRRAVHASTRRE